MSVHLWLRAESKPGEERAPVTPAGVRRLLDAGVRITVEQSSTRVFKDDEYASAGATMVPNGAWPSAPNDAVILGIKELPTSDTPLAHRHVYFAHAFKEQKGWRDLLRRFKDGGGTLLDLEYLKRDDGRRVAAFGYWAGYVGAAAGVLAVAHLRTGSAEPMAGLRPWPGRAQLIAVCQAALGAGRAPSTIVLGAKGRSGSGAVALLQAVGAPVTSWDLEETRAGGPFDAILAHELFVNAVLVQGPLQPFVTRAQIVNAGLARRLAVIADVSCDPHSPHNPVPLYDDTTTMEHPTVRAIGGRGDVASLDVVAIDHLPSLLPRESSEDFAEQLLPHLLELAQGSPVWRGAEQVYRDALARL
ncbi:MAG: saccharopine dehydrogenase [Deltaproteobacteria bacterium]|nr:saccharopine dehydrogenase [Deltaproteobacteria bacterium]